MKVVSEVDGRRRRSRNGREGHQFLLRVRGRRPREECVALGGIRRPECFEGERRWAGESFSCLRGHCQDNSLSVDSQKLIGMREKWGAGAELRQREVF